ncbi:hypothetical protein [Rhizobium sp. BK176]|uniref:hypothetical protein n=1 Tax=Rhizobium sp. BK176 TaxID=2587071 RepID=UPI00216916A8|nr:hypothetical protein [Rhizobium sp. BK176]MCS4089328.1 hypothetical protein [Rhizobium sp. BK176]
MDIDFELPVVFNAIPHGRKTKATMVGTVPVSVDLAECGRGELDPVATVRFDGQLDRPTSYFHRGGDLFVPHCRLEDLPRTFVPYEKNTSYLFHKADRSIRLTVDNARMDGRRSYVYPKALAEARTWTKPLDLRPLTDIKFTEPYQDGIDSQISRHRERCARLLLSEGLVYLRVSEPVIAVDLDLKNGVSDAWIRPLWRSSHGITTAKTDPIPPHAVFRLDDEDGLLSFLAAAGVPDSRPENWNTVSVALHDASRLAVDSSEMSVYSAGARIVKKAQDWLGEHQVIDDLFRIVERSNDTEYPSQLGDLLLDALAIHRDGIRVFSNEYDVLGTRLVTEMWDDRSVSLALPSFK